MDFVETSPRRWARLYLDRLARRCRWKANSGANSVVAQEANSIVGVDRRPKWSEAARLDYLIGKEARVRFVRLSHGLRGHLAEVTYWRNLESSGIIWKNLEPSGNIWSHLESVGIIWRHLEASRGTWSHLEASGIIWRHLESS